MTRVLVIGAGGVFGSRLCEGLLSHGFEVVAAGRDLSRAEAMAGRQPALTVIITGIFDEDWLVEIEAVAAA